MYALKSHIDKDHPLVVKKYENNKHKREIGRKIPV